MITSVQVLETVCTKKGFDLPKVLLMYCLTPRRCWRRVCTKKGFDPPTVLIMYCLTFPRRCWKRSAPRRGLTRPPTGCSTTANSSTPAPPFASQVRDTPFSNQSLVIWATFSATYRYHRVVPNSLFAGLSATFLLCLTFNFN